MKELYVPNVVRSVSQAGKPEYVTMEIFKDKYYIEDEVLYKCTRDSDTALSHYLFSLVGLYVEVV